LVPALQECFHANVWVMGLSELRPGGLFEPWRLALADAYDCEGGAGNGGRPAGKVYGFNHFSMGSFATDLKRRRLPGEPVPDAVMRIGAENRHRIFGDAPG
jgi:hypothetical protein